MASNLQPNSNNIQLILILFSFHLSPHQNLDKKLSGKSRDEQMAEKKQELEKRLQDVTGQLGTGKKTTKKGKKKCKLNCCERICSLSSLYMRV